MKASEKTLACSCPSACLFPRFHITSWSAPARQTAKWHTTQLRSNCHCGESILLILYYNFKKKVNKRCQFGISLFWSAEKAILCEIRQNNQLYKSDVFSVTPYLQNMLGSSSPIRKKMMRSTKKWSTRCKSVLNNFKMVDLCLLGLQWHSKQYPALIIVRSCCPGSCNGSKPLFILNKPLVLG